MKTLFAMIGLVVLSGCSEPPPKRVLSKIQLEAIESMSKVEQAYMESCLEKAYMSFSGCLKEALALKQPEQPNNAGSAAAGAFLGAGAARLVFGK